MRPESYRRLTQEEILNAAAKLAKIKSGMARLESNNEELSPAMLNLRMDYENLFHRVSPNDSMAVVRLAETASLRAQRARIIKQKWADQARGGGMSHGSFFTTNLKG